MDLLSFAFLLTAVALAWNWWADRRAADAATRVAQRACQQAGVIWLDQNVQRVRKRLARNDEGRTSRRGLRAASCEARRADRRQSAMLAA